MISLYIQNLFDDVRNILVLHRCEKWRNSWMWDQTSQYIEFNYLIYLESDGTFHYHDIETFSIELEFYDNNYRIDIRDKKQNIHNWWSFKENEFLIVETYIKKLIQQKYDSIENFSRLLNLSEKAYNIKPEKMYYEMNIKLRKQKLQKLNDETNL